MDRRGGVDRTDASRHSGIVQVPAILDGLVANLRRRPAAVAVFRTGPNEDLSRQGAMSDSQQSSTAIAEGALTDCKRVNCDAYTELARWLQKLWPKAGIVTANI